MHIDRGALRALGLEQLLRADFLGATTPPPGVNLPFFLLENLVLEDLHQAAHGLDQVPIEVFHIVHAMRRRESGVKGLFLPIPLSLVRLHVDREGSRGHDVRELLHRLSDDIVQRLVDLRLLLEPADLDEELLSFPEAREEQSEVYEALYDVIR